MNKFDPTESRAADIINAAAATKEQAFRNPIQAEPFAQGFLTMHHNPYVENLDGPTEEIIVDTTRFLRKVART